MNDNNKRDPKQAVEPSRIRQLMSVPRRLAPLAFMALALALAIAGAAPAWAGCDDDDRPGAPHSLKAVPLGSTGIMLQWSSNVGHYDIYIRDKNGRGVPEAPDITGGATNRNYLEFYGLKPDKEYFFSMRARSEGGTQGCISKNASETVSARTDTADLQKVCSDYEKTAQENIHVMQLKGCPLPGSPYAGNWATQKGAHFTYCLEQKRARLNGDANAQWERNRDLVACNEKAAKCWSYAGAATTAELTNRELKCGYTGPRWSLFISGHFAWCMSPSTSQYRRIIEGRTRNRLIRQCKAKKAAEAKKAEEAQNGGGSEPNCAGAPAEWADMLAAHNELRGQYCGAPLTWSCSLAAEAQKFAEDCACGHSNAPGVGENLAVRGVEPDKYPAGTDRQAFDDTWGCEKTEFHFDNPVIVGGFKEDCHKGKDGNPPVNGHFTQIVWRSNQQLGCGRARCPVKDKDCKEVQPKKFETHWVCRYRGFDGNGNSIGGNDSSKLADNVQQPPNCTVQKFHSLSATKCYRGMVLNAAGKCACRNGEFWNGRICLVRSRPSPGRTTGTPPKQPTPPPTCPAERPVGSPPNCCPTGTAFSDGVCRKGSGGFNSVKRPVCSGDRPVGTFPNCCPTGRTFINGACRKPGDGGGGSNGVQLPGCKGDRPVGTPPNCCPIGRTFINGACRKPGDGGGGSNGVNQPVCSGDRPVGTFPNCCPIGRTFSNGACRKPGDGGGGSNGVQQPGCKGDRPVGTPPNCCPTGTTFSNGACRKPRGSGGGGGGGGSNGVQQPGCTGDRPVGTPPNCCPTGTTFSNGACRVPDQPKQGGGGGGGSKTTPPARCPASKPFGTPPNNCCSSDNWNPTKQRCEVVQGPK